MNAGQLGLGLARVKLARVKSAGPILSQPDGNVFNKKGLFNESWRKDVWS